MPLEDFTKTAYKGLLSGSDEGVSLSPGIGKEACEDILGKRRKAFEGLAKLMRGGN